MTKPEVCMTGCKIMQPIAYGRQKILTEYNIVQSLEYASNLHLFYISSMT